jgi:hypothetical protein
MLDKYDMQAATGHVGMADFLACAQRCPSTVGASVDAYVTEVLNERGLAVGVAAGGMTMVAQSAQRCPSTVGAPASMHMYVTEVLDKGGVAVGVAAGGMTMVAQSAQRCPSTVDARGRWQRWRRKRGWRRLTNGMRRWIGESGWAA